jgi:hypothetical protein
MYMYVSIHIYVYMHIHNHIYEYDIYIYIFILYMYIYLYHICMYIYVYTYTYIHVDICMYVCMFVFLYIHTYMFTYMYSYMYIYSRILIHMYIYIHKFMFLHIVDKVCTHVYVGQFTEIEIGNLLGVLGNPPTVIWNLSGKSFSSVVIAKLNCQTVDVPWVCLYLYLSYLLCFYVCIYTCIFIRKERWSHLQSVHVSKCIQVTPNSCTQLPNMECILAQCFSIKSFLDVSSNHVAIVHCSNGRSRSGILIACLLKYIGAFDYSYQAFDFFCNARYELV